MKRTGAEIIVESLMRQGITVVSGIPGGTNLPLYDALGRSPIYHILARHEQGAGFIAQGMARVSGQPAVCIATSGPGATNLITAVADAYMDSIPLVAISGQVPLSMMGTDAFQEVDAYGMSLPVTKHNFMARSAMELLSIMPEAFEIAGSGRPGPVWIDVPKDVQLETAEFAVWPEPGRKITPAAPAMSMLTEAADLINGAERPLFYLGGGAAGASAALRALAERAGIPAVATLMGLGNITGRYNLGMLGMHAERSTNMIMNRADLLIVVGARFDDRATGRLDRFCPQARVVHIDIDAAEIGKIRPADCAIGADAATAVSRMLPLIERRERAEWQQEIARLQCEFPAAGQDTPRRLIMQIAELAEDDAIITTDVGQHQMWTAQTYPFRRPGQFLTSGGLGTMGFGLPAAIGAAVAGPERQVICFSGDGSIMMNIQELATLAEQNLNVKIIILNNGHLGLVRQQQELFYNANYTACRFEKQVDFKRIAEGFGIPAASAIDADLLNFKGPALLDLPIAANEMVYPMVPPGGANVEMIGGAA